MVLVVSCLILAYFSNALIWVFLTHRTNSKIVPSTFPTVGITVIFLKFPWLCFCHPLEWQNPVYGISFFCYERKVLVFWPSPTKYSASHLVGCILFLHIPFSSMVKFPFLAQFPVCHLSYPFLPRLLFAYYGINRFNNASGLYLIEYYFIDFI